ncbi:hypothetical protein B7760_05233 [Burkholderia glumae]|uniref:hypothetical protein n=1 Tax=Burkholderia glumae TaxID=337 RepID=UPI0013740C9E|nr:hypothetical protein [Burkholderia glumae]MCR1768324.1 hypothetical protein [Burkholderia glumae]QHP93497.1 hypothetical protein EXE55_21625 [Burkholderia glumae]QKM51167.1 hypothetical protein B7760_05233 [Burkholderia glumae]
MKTVVMKTEPVLHQPEPGAPEAPELPETEPQPAPDPGHQPEPVPPPYRQPDAEPPPVRGLAPGRSSGRAVGARLGPASWRALEGHLRFDHALITSAW